MIRFLLPFAVAIIMVPSFAASGENCRDCHGQKGLPGFIDQEAFRESAHGIFHCTGCHLNIASYPHGTVAKVNCGVCHFPGRNGAPTEKAREYKLSVHNRISPVGRNAAPTCQTCHGSHYIYPATDSRSATRRQNIPALCSRCHPSESEEYGKSIHGIEAVDRNNANAPTCFDCHQEHLVPPTGDARWMLSLIEQCGNCHQHQIKTYRGLINTWRTLEKAG